ncbi:hypothetical protein DD238_003319 [Peronospora effusa]|uniref:Uncharacterized protein n=1 Tax=Peronospora effusa TaxID=542832 RepID=A0A3M6VHR8_9STRA|nr:hypothetical protein DD238_003319 [Peronospora effusa]
MTFERLGHTEFTSFQIGITRALLRHNKMVGEFHSIGRPHTHAGQNDSDRLVNADELPEKKRVKVSISQREVFSDPSFRI